MTYGNGILNTVTEHEETDLCTGVHCVYHQVDEFGGRTYIRCGECGHQYRTKRDLVWAYRAVIWSMIRSGGWKWIATPFDPGLRSLVHRLLFRRAKDIHFCQFCIHDF